MNFVVNRSVTRTIEILLKATKAIQVHDFLLVSNLSIRWHFFNIFIPQRIPIIFWRWELQVKTSQRTSKIQFPVDLRLWKRMWRERLVTVSSAHWAENSWTTVKRCIQSEHVLLKSNTVLSNAFAEAVWGEVNGWDGERKGCKRMGRPSPLHSSEAVWKKTKLSCNTLHQCSATVSLESHLLSSFNQVNSFYWRSFSQITKLYSRHGWFKRATVLSFRYLFLLVYALFQGFQVKVL